jgi:hypothetical protein
MNPDDMPVIPLRDELSKCFEGSGVELGVASGVFSKTICENKKGDGWHYAIDRWSDHHGSKEYIHACKVLAKFPKCAVLRMTFTEAAKEFEDGSLSYVYVDGYAHTGQLEGQTYREWWPKLKVGGLFCGHDIHPRWQKTVEALEAFAAETGFRYALTQADEFPSFFGVRRT